MLVIVLAATPAYSVVPAPWVVFEGFSPRPNDGEMVPGGIGAMHRV